MPDESHPAPPGDRSQPPAELIPVAITQVEVDQAGYPSEVMCRMCRNLMLPDNLAGSSWTCYVCSRRIVVVPRPAEDPRAEA